MIHTRRPLQEKMALFWHNHFATAYSKLNVDSGATQAAKMMAYTPGALRGPLGQIELFRQNALGNFRDLLVKVAQDAAMLVWLDGQSNTAARPQENFGREVMELFTVGVGHYTEPDVYAAARVFTGWNLQKSEGYSNRRPQRVPGVRLQRGRPRHQRQDVLVPDLRQRQPHDSRARRGGGNAGRRRSDHGAGHAPGDGARGSRASSGTSLSARSTNPTRNSSPPRPPFTCRAAPRSGRSSATSSCRRGSAIRRCASRAIPGRPSSWCGRSRKWDGRASRSTRQRRRSPTWACSSSSRRTSADGRSAPAGFRRRRCWRAATSARRWSRARSRSWRRRWRRTGRPLRACWRRCSIGSRPRRSIPIRSRCWRRTSSPAGRGRAARSNSRHGPSGLARLLVGSAEYQLV